MPESDMANGGSDGWLMALIGAAATFFVGAVRERYRMIRERRKQHTEATVETARITGTTDVERRKIDNAKTKMIIQQYHLLVETLQDRVTGLERGRNEEVVRIEHQYQTLCQALNTSIEDHHRRFDALQQFAGRQEKSNALIREQYEVLNTSYEESLQRAEMYRKQHEDCERRLTAIELQLDREQQKNNRDKSQP